MPPFNGQYYYRVTEVYHSIVAGMLPPHPLQKLRKLIHVQVIEQQSHDAAHVPSIQFSDIPHRFHITHMLLPNQAGRGLFPGNEVIGGGL